MGPTISSLGIFPVRTADHQHDRHIVFNLIDCSVVANSDSIGPVGSDQLLHPVRAGGAAKDVQGRYK